ncbi:hypothetical protein ESCOMMO059M2_03575 [Escherichia coli]
MFSIKNQDPEIYLSTTPHCYHGTLLTGSKFQIKYIRISKLYNKYY